MVSVTGSALEKVRELVLAQVAVSAAERTSPAAASRLLPRWFRPEPEYSEEARKAKWSGAVTISLVVDVNGMPKDIQVIKALGMGLDQKAIEAVQKWRFRPGTKDGKPVPVQAVIEVNFRLL
jgi:TonB family protein